MYSIKAVSKATGLSVETLRAWERRHGIVQPARDGTGRRVYRPEDVRRLSRLREATERGHAISRLANLSDEGLAELLADGPVRQTRAAANAFVSRILDAAENFSPAEMEQALTLAVALLAPTHLIMEVLQPVLHEVGERWHRGELSIAQERLVSSCVRRHVSLILESYEKLADGPVAVFATLAGERHELGLLMTALIAASRGCRCHYLGPDLPAAEIAQFAGRVAASAVALSLVVRTGLPSIATDLSALRAGLPEATQIWIGGPASRELPAPSLPEGCVVIADEAELEHRLSLLVSTPRPARA